MERDFLIETSIIIAHLKDLPEADILTELERRQFSSVICLGELYEGIFLVNKVDQKKIRRGIEKYFLNLDGILPVDENIVKIFAQIRALLRKKGEIIGDLDLLIAASCLFHDLILVTLNYKDFQRIPKLKIFRT